MAPRKSPGNFGPDGGDTTTSSVAGAGIAMADVYFEPSVLVPSEMLHAFCSQRFTGLQIKLVLRIALLSQHRRPRTVRISRQELAAGMDMTCSGAFLSALRDVIARGVVVVVDRNSGRRPPTYRVRANPDQWQPLASRRQRAYPAVGHSGAALQVAV
jgi:hypothetical protein